MVTCVCPTTPARRKWLPLAIQCFLDQTYEPRELLIVSEWPEAIRDLLPYSVALRGPAYPNIRLIRCPGGLRLGAKRNFCCELAGETIVHWDDDDWSAPGRLADQMERMRASGKAVTGYSRMKFTDGKNWWRYEPLPYYAFGTSLCYSKEWWRRNQFPDIAVASDYEVIFTAIAQGQLSVVEAGNMMFARVHADSTNKRDMSNRATWTPIPVEEALALRWAA